MKKILGLALGLMISALTFAQSAVVFTDAGSSYDKATTTVFHFISDETISNEDIAKNSAYYTDYFTVSAVANDSGHDIKITLVQDDEISRKVIQRFFVSLSLKAIDVNGIDIKLIDFMTTYILK